MALTADMLPLMAASRLKGSDEDPRDEKGGSTRVKGAETRRVFEIPACLRGGDRPAGAVSGARGDEVLARAGVRAGINGGGGMVFTGVDMVKVNGFSQESLLLFLNGENSEGSVFSPSASSYVGVNARLFVDLAGEDAVNGLPLRGELFARKPGTVRLRYWTGRVELIVTYHFDGSSQSLVVAHGSCSTRQRALLPWTQWWPLWKSSAAPTGVECSRAVIQHLVIDGQVACFDRQQSVEDTTTSDNSTVHEVLVVKRAWKTSELAEKKRITQGLR